MYDRDGYDMKWTIPTAGEYTLTVSQPNVKYPIDPSLTVKDATGNLVLDLGPEAGTAGGLLVAKGTPEEIAEVEESRFFIYARSEDIK